jgi:hypothetical protein
MNELDSEVSRIKEHYINPPVSARDRGDSLVHAFDSDNIKRVPESSQKPEQVRSRVH